MNFIVFQHTFLNFISYPYFETSAATGQNVTKAFETLLGMVMLRIQKTVDSGIPGRRRGGAGLQLESKTSASGQKICAC